LAIAFICETLGATKPNDETIQKQLKKVQMIDSINDYKLDSNVNTYGDLLTPFGHDGYEWARMFGRPPLFKKEKYYWAEKNHFLERECSQAMISAINDIIYKISFRFHDTETEKCVTIRMKVYDHIANFLGKHTEMQEIDDNHKAIIWQTNKGNVVADLDGFDTEIILTSSSVRNAKKNSIFERFFGK